MTILSYLGTTLITTHFIVCLSFIVIAYTLDIYKIDGKSYKIIDVPGLDSFMLKTIIMTSFSGALVINGIMLNNILSNKVYALIGFLLITGFIVSTVLTFVELLNFTAPDIKEVKTIESIFKYSNYGAYGVGGLGSLLLMISYISNFFSKK
jgi:hypothetical protein